MNIKDFLIDNYIYIIIVIILTIITIIGFLADKKKTGNKIVKNGEAPVPPAPTGNVGNVAPMTYQPPQDNLVQNNMAMPNNNMVAQPAPEPVMNNNMNQLPGMMNNNSQPIPETVLNNSIKSEPMPNMMNGQMMQPIAPAPEPVNPIAMSMQNPQPAMVPNVEPQMNAPMPTYNGNMGMNPEPMAAPVNNMQGMPNPIPNPNMGAMNTVPTPMPQQSMGTMPTPMPNPQNPQMNGMPNNANMQNSPVSFVYGQRNDNQI